MTLLAVGEARKRIMEENLDVFEQSQCEGGKTTVFPVAEHGLLALARAVGAERVRVTPANHGMKLDAGVSSVSTALAVEVRRRIEAGQDVLGELFTGIRSPADRRPLGATYTPEHIVRLMVDWAARHAIPERVVDPGVGSGRFLVEAGRRFPHATLLGIDVDPVAALLARAHLAAAGMAERAEIVVGDYRSLSLPPIRGRTLFLGNPPYVRHHLVSPAWKQWLAVKARALDVAASQLAGLHAYFFLATALVAQPGDFGVFITAAEWLDVNYGQLMRELFLGPLGGQGIVVLDPTLRPFPDAATTAAVTMFVVGDRPSAINIARVDDLAACQDLSAGRRVHRDRLSTERRWSRLTHAPRTVPDEHVELGELCRVHRGAVTGANKVWIVNGQAVDLPSSVLFPSVTRARELIQADGELVSDHSLRRVIDLPIELDVFDGEERRAVERFLKQARAYGAHESYVATHRRAWWSIGLRQPPPILATYMARRPPAFVLNRANARYINIAHGLYPRIRLGERGMSTLARFLSRATSTTDGRTYAGGLTKFEPREMERLLVPSPKLLEAGQEL